MCMQWRSGDAGGSCRAAAADAEQEAELEALLEALRAREAAAAAHAEAQAVRALGSHFAVFPCHFVPNSPRGSFISPGTPAAVDDALCMLAGGLVKLSLVLCNVGLLHAQTARTDQEGVSVAVCVISMMWPTRQTGHMILVGWSKDRHL